MRCRSGSPGPEAALVVNELSVGILEWMAVGVVECDLAHELTIDHQVGSPR